MPGFQVGAPYNEYEFESKSESFNILVVVPFSIFRRMRKKTEYDKLLHGQLCLLKVYRELTEIYLSA